MTDPEPPDAIHPQPTPDPHTPQITATPAPEPLPDCLCHQSLNGIPLVCDRHRAVVAQKPYIDRSTKTPQEAVVAFMGAIEAGIPARRAATECGINIRTAYGILARHEGDLDDMRNAVRKLLQVEALDRLDNWRTAAEVGAKLRGNHTPSKDWLLHAGILDPLASEAGPNVRIAINIGTDEQPMKIKSPRQTLKDDTLDHKP